MSLPSCRRCGETDPDRMVGLMTLWFASLIEIEPAHGYFHLCPRCYGEAVAPHIDDIVSHLAKLDPAAAEFLDKEE